MKNNKKVINIIAIIVIAILLFVSAASISISKYKFSTRGAVKVCDYGCTFDGFYVDGDDVIFKCRVTLENTSNKPVKYMIIADFTSDSISGLVTEPLLIGFSDKKFNNNVFEIGANEKTEVMNVMFITPHCKKAYYKLTRNMPDLKIIEL